MWHERREDLKCGRTMLPSRSHSNSFWNNRMNNVLKAKQKMWDLDNRFKQNIEPVFINVTDDSASDESEDEV